MLEGEFGEITPQMLGDVVISAQSAQAMSQETGTAFESVLHLLLVHGILHLLSLDHEAGQAEAHGMKRKTEQLLSMLGHRGDEFEWFFGD
jgi:probable rRNA maturation factor